MRELPVTKERFLSEEQRRGVEALFEAILPGTDRGPGARDAGAADYLDCLLATDESTYYEIAGWKRLYSALLPALDAASRRRLGAPLADLAVGQARDLLGMLARGELDELPAEMDGKRLLATLRAHCIEGCFSDPRWQGNREGIVWRWLGYAQPPHEFRRGEDGVLREVK